MTATRHTPPLRCATDTLAEPVSLCLSLPSNSIGNTAAAAAGRTGRSVAVVKFMSAGEARRGEARPLTLTLSQ